MGKKMNREFLRQIGKRRRELINSDYREGHSIYAPNCIDIYAPNCIGAAFYLTGELNEDGHCYEKLPFILERLKEISSPETGSIFALETEGEPYHMGVVVNLNPLLIANRNGRGGNFNPRQPLDEILKNYGKNSEGITGEIKYYRPTAMEKKKK